METHKEFIIAARTQYLVYLCLAAGVVGGAALLYCSDNFLFDRFFGGVNPVIVILAAGMAGFILLSFFLRRGYFVIFNKQNLKKLFPSLSLTALLAVVMIFVDISVVFPADLNIQFPESVLFYPVIGFFVEIFFHLLPLGVLLILLTFVLKNAGKGVTMWVCIFLVSLLEPFYQTSIMSGSGLYPQWTVGYVGIHLFAFNFLQLYTFRRHDFISMYLLRIVYYLIWHIGWGQVRIGLLF